MIEKNKNKIGKYNCVKILEETSEVIMFECNDKTWEISERGEKYEEKKIFVNRAVGNDEDIKIFCVNSEN